MPYAFTLIVDGPDLQAAEAVDALFAGGCDDGTVGVVAGVQFIEFDRDGESFLDAVAGAVAAVESAVAGARVVHVEPDELVTMAEIAERTSRTRESIRLLIAGARGPGGFPPPATHFRSRHRMWRWPAVATWLTEALGEPPSSEDDLGRHRMVAAINAGLAFRNSQRGLASAERRRLRRLVS